MLKYELLVLLIMIWMHVFDDFVLQTFWLSNGKQKDWWIKVCEESDYPFPFYKWDYKASLIIHSVSWCISVMVAPLIYFPLIHKIDMIWFLFIFAINVTIHYLVDNAKANLKIFSLVVDQIIHLIQILFTWLAFILIYAR